MAIERMLARVGKGLATMVDSQVRYRESLGTEIGKFQAEITEENYQRTGIASAALVVWHVVICLINLPRWTDASVPMNYFVPVYGLGLSTIGMGTLFLLVRHLAKPGGWLTPRHQILATWFFILWIGITSIAFEAVTQGMAFTTVALFQPVPFLGTMDQNGLLLVTFCTYVLSRIIFAGRVREFLRVQTIERQAREVLEEHRKNEVLRFALHHGLTPREAEILPFLYEGFSNQEIAARTFVGIDTVKKHLYHIYQKVGVETRIQLIRKVDHQAKAEE